MPRPFPLLESSQLDAKQREFYDTFPSRSGELSQQRLRSRAGGPIEGPWNVWLRNPEIGLAITKLSTVLRNSSVLSPRLREIVILFVVEPGSFAWVEHELKGRKAGLTEKDIGAIRNRTSLSCVNEVEQLVADATLQLVQTGDLTDDVFANCERVLGVAGVIDLTTLVSHYKAVDMLIRIYRIAPLSNSAD